MKIKIWVAITDGGDGEHHVSFYPSKESLIEKEGINDEGFDYYGYFVEIESMIVETEEYEVVS